MPGPGPAASKDRTLLVYMAGDNNNLAAETEAKINAIAQGWRNTYSANLLIYQDIGTPRLLQVVTESGQTVIKTIREFPAENSASPAVFNRVITDVLTNENYKAKRYGMLIFSHATGWLPGLSYHDPMAIPVKSVLRDGNQVMELTDFATAIPDKKFDVIAFETCLMGGVEAAYELRNKADYLVVSPAEIISPGFTPYYSRMIGFLLQPTANPEGFAMEYFNSIMQISGYRQTATMCVVKTVEIDALAAIIRRITANGTTVTYADDIQHFDSSLGDRDPHWRLFFDFGVWVRLQATASQYAEFEAQMARALPLRKATDWFLPGHVDGFPMTDFSGLTTYIEQPQYPYLNEEYRKLSWYRAIH
ncbi:MAG: hypothetical protein LBU80_05060 [Rikenellaceae bacterium]|nr:hypothetical protein [Rikenellaceae bacterium]